MASFDQGKKSASALEWLESLKFIYSEGATKFCEIFTLHLSYIVPVKSKVKILKNFVAFSEYIKQFGRSRIILDLL